MIYPYSEYSDIEIKANLLLQEFVKTDEFKSFKREIDALVKGTDLIFSSIMIDPCYEAVLDYPLEECELSDPTGDDRLDFTSMFAEEFSGLAGKSASDLHYGEQDYSVEQAYSVLGDK